MKPPLASYGRLAFTVVAVIFFSGAIVIAGIRLASGTAADAMVQLLGIGFSLVGLYLVTERRPATWIYPWEYRRSREECERLVTYGGHEDDPDNRDRA